MKARLAYSAIGWNKPLSEIARSLASVECHAMEAFGLAEPLPGDEALLQVLRETGVQISSCYVAGSFVERDRLRGELVYFGRTVDAIAAVGGQFVVVGGGKVRKGCQRTDWRTFVRTIHEMAETSATSGVRLVFHPHIGTLVTTREEIHRLARDTDPSLIGLAFDTAHLARGGCDLHETFQAFLNRVSYVHLKDLKGDEFVALGEGALPLGDVSHLLEQANFAGWIAIELDETENPIEKAIANVKFARERLGIHQ